MKLTTPKKVIDIIQPAAVAIRPNPSVGLFDAVSRVVVIMLRHDLKHIAVMQHGKIIGCVYLSEALDELGIGPGSGKKTDGRWMEDG